MVKPLLYRFLTAIDLDISNKSSLAHKICLENVPLNDYILVSRGFVLLKSVSLGLSVISVHWRLNTLDIAAAKACQNVLRMRKLIIQVYLWKWI